MKLLKSLPTRCCKQTVLVAPTAARLRVRLDPHLGESLRGYLLRLTSANGYETTRWLASLEPVLMRITQEQVAIEAIERLTGFSDLEPFLLSPFGSNMLPAHFRATTPRICPACLKERGYYDSVWEIGFACVCPHHGIMLVDACSRCHAPLTWSHLSVTCCSCGANIIDAGTTLAGADLQYFNAKIWAAAGRDVPHFKSASLPDKELSRLSLGQLCQFFLFFNAHENGTISMMRAKPTSVAATVTALEIVRSVLSDWPQGFYQRLVKRVNKKEEFSGEGLQQVFGGLYIRLYRYLVGPEFSFIRDAFEEFLRDHWFGVISGTYRRVNRDKTRNDALNLRGAAKTLGIGRRIFRRIVGRGWVKGDVILRSSGRCRIMVSEKDTLRFRDQVGHRINGKQTRELLGISKNQFYMLVQEEFIQPLLRAGEDGCGSWWFDAGPIKRLLDKIKVAAPAREPCAEAISFREACQWHILSSENFPLFFAAILNGTISVTGVKCNSEFNLASLYFLPESIAEFKAKLRIRPDGNFSIPEAAIRLGVKQEVAYHLVNAGLLASSFYASKKIAGRMVSESDIEAFEKEYISLAQLARSNGTSPRALKQKYDAAAISASTGRDIDGCRQFFYRRADL